ncbi:hypothetical protein D3C81_1494380 [compost metagenome]
MVGFIGRTCGFGGVTGNLLSSGGHLVHRRGHLIGTLELVMGTARHVASDAAQLATGAFQLLGIVLEAANGFGKEITQGIGRTRKAAQFILAAAVDPGAKAALAQLRYVLDQLADRLDQATVDPPQAQ